MRTTEIRYTWDEADLRWAYSRPADLDIETLPWAGWVDAAICGLTIAILEWPIFRLAPFHSDRTPENALEAAWCANIDRAYCETLEFSRREWTGPIRGPLLTCLNLMNEALYECPEAGTRPLHAPLLADGLVKHVCEESYEAFAVWKVQVIDRLERYYQAPDPFSDLYGEAASRLVVPPQAFDPDINFEISRAPRLADDFLKSIDYRENPLLVTPEQMESEGFEGTPYRYSPDPIQYQPSE